MTGELGDRVRDLRHARGLTQHELASHAGVSRQLVGAVENGRHLPRVDAAVALARVLGTSVEALLDPPPTTAAAVAGALPPAGSPVRVGRVGERLVCAPMAASWEGWGRADGVLRADGIELIEGARPGAVVTGCDPALGLAAHLASHGAPEPVLAVPCSTGEALAALADGRTHACVVHGRAGELPTPPVEVTRWHLSRWQVGLAAPADAPAGWWRDALAGRTPVIQRRPGAAAQAAFERAVTEAGGVRPAGPLVGGHLEAVGLSTHTGLPAVTIEPAALAAGLVFQPLELHVAQLWIATPWADQPGVRRLGDVVTSPAFERRLAAVGGYDLAGCGTRVTA